MNDLRKLLKNIGYSESEIEVYIYLLVNGKRKPGNISKMLGIKRPTVYKALYLLEDKSLIIRVSGTAESAEFEVNNPKYLDYRIKKHFDKIERVKNDFYRSYPEVIRFYTNNHSLPVVDTLLGLEGLKKIHLDIEDNKYPVDLIRSAFDRDTDDLIREINRHVAKRSKLGIDTRIISPQLSTVRYTLESFREIDGRKIRLIPQYMLNIPSQIMLYDKKVVITNYKNEIISLIIHQNEIFSSFKILFDTLWELPIENSLIV